MKTNTNLSKEFFFLLILFFWWVNPVNSQVAGHNKMSAIKSSGYAKVNGLKIYYEVHGEGEPLVLLHGSFMTISLNWGQLIPELSKTRKVIALELQGHGRTEDSDRVFSFTSLASDVAGVIKFLKLDSADVLGYSFGGIVALQLAVQDPKLVKKLIIISSVYKDDGWLPQVREMMLSFQPDFFDNTPLKTEYDSLAPNPSYWHRFVDKLLKFEAQPFDIGEQNIRSIKSPTLLIMGDNDGVDMEHKMKFYKLLGGDVFADITGLPKSRLAILPSATHVSLMMEGEKLCSLINTFLTNNQ